MGGQGGSKWTPAGSQPPQPGYILDGSEPHEVSFKTGGKTGDQTLISDGHVDKKTFDESHDHHGSKAEGGWIDESRGYYTGPGH